MLTVQPKAVTNHAKRSTPTRARRTMRINNTCLFTRTQTFCQFLLFNIELLSMSLECRRNDMIASIQADVPLTSEHNHWSPICSFLLTHLYRTRKQMSHVHQELGPSHCSKINFWNMAAECNISIDHGSLHCCKRIHAKTNSQRKCSSASQLMLSLLAISTYWYLQLLMLVQHQKSLDHGNADWWQLVSRTEFIGIWDEMSTDADNTATTDWPMMDFLCHNSPPLSGLWHMMIVQYQIDCNTSQ